MNKNDIIEAIANIRAEEPSPEIIEELDQELIQSLAEILKQRHSKDRNGMVPLDKSELTNNAS